jgi:hypothetical protein
MARTILPGLAITSSAEEAIVRKRNLIHFCLCAAPCIAWHAAAADPSNTARVGDFQFGNVIDLRGWGASLQLPATEGMSRLHLDMLRTPSGVQYSYPFDPLEMKPIGADWLYAGSVGVGYVGALGDDEALWFVQYSDWGDDVIAQFSFDFERPETGDYVEVRGSRLGENNQYYRVRGGRAGKYRVEAFYKDVPHVISTAAYSLWEGVGTTALTLPDGLTPGGSTVEEVAAVSERASRRTLRVDRARAGISVELGLSPRWTGYVSLTNEAREGTRLWGGSMFFAFIPDNGGVNETVRPIDFTTTDTALGVRFVGDVWHFSLAYAGSFFRNHKDRLDYESPWILSTVLGPAVPPAGVISQGQFSLEPDNDYHNLRAELSRSLGWNGKVSIAASAATLRQDDRLLPPVTCTGLGGIFIAPPADYTFDCAEWNTTAALSKQSADARIDTRMVDVRAAFRPTAAFGWRVGLKHYSEDNKTRYLAYNPITGQYGYISENGSQGSVVPGETGIFDPNNPLYASYVVPVRNVPFEYSQTTAELSADWWLGHHSLTATYTFERTEPEYRERSRLEDQRLTLAWIYKMSSGASLRVSYELADRSGDAYNFDPYDEFYSVSLPGFVEPPGGVMAHTVEAMRKYDLADRRQNKLRAIFIQPIGMAATLSMTLYGNYNDYDAALGRRGAWITGTSLQWDFQPNPKTAWSAYVGYDYSHYRIANVADDESNLTSDPRLGGPTFPLANRWDQDDREDSYHAGFAFKQMFGRHTLDVGYSFTLTQGDVSYSYASLGAIAGTQQPFADDLGSRFPGNEYRLHALDAGLTTVINERCSTRLFARYEIGRFADFHYAGFDEARVHAHRVYTDAGPAQKYDAGAIGLVFYYKL